MAHASPCPLRDEQKLSTLTIESLAHVELYQDEFIMAKSSTYSVKEIANWILDFADFKNVKLTNMALNKLVYFAYEHSLMSTGRKLTNAKIEAWDHGPVFREIYSAFKKYGAEPISERASRYNPGTNSVEIVKPTIAPSDEVLLIEVIEPLIRLPAYILREISHDAAGAWSQVWYHAGPANPGMEITDEIILGSKSTARNLL